jgi:hypothetical protein
LLKKAKTFREKAFSSIDIFQNALKSAEIPQNSGKIISPEWDKQVTSAIADECRFGRSMRNTKPKSNDR